MLFIVSILVLGACTQRMICPAYQSAFIYDKESLRKKFSYFVDDSTPKILTASKTKYLVAEPVSYQHKLRQMQTIEMKPIQPIVPDSLLPGYQPPSLAELDSAANSIIDSTYIVDVDQQADTTQSVEDSVYVITKDKEVRLLKYDMDSLKYSVVEVRLNVDQDNYMWYLRDHLVLPDVRLAKMQGAAKNGEAKKEKKGFFGFFKNLFKKKKKDKVDSARVIPANKEGEEFDYVDTVEHATPVDQVRDQPKKKGFFSFLKKKKKADNPTEQDGDNAIAPAEDKPEKKKKDKKKKDEPVEDEPLKETEKEKDDGF
jgi:hypothetical protein